MAKFEIKDGVAIIPEGTTEIENYAFSECASLENITIPESVTVIGYGAFFLCSSLKSITIPESVTTIGEAAFVGCSSLESIVVADGNPVYDSREGCNAIIETKTNILRCGCKSTIIPESVTKIGRHAFAGCASLESITIPESVTEFGDFAFCNCKLLESITIPESVTKIGNSAFKGCSSLKSITIPESVTEIDSLAFFSCTSLKCVTFLYRTKLSDEVFSYSSRRTINVPSDCVDYYTEVLPEKFHDKIVEFEKVTKANHLETIKEVSQHLETLIEKIDSLDFCPIFWEDSFALLYELRDAMELIDKLSEQLDTILIDDSFWNDLQNKDLVENLKEAGNCLIEFSSYFSSIDHVLEEEGPKEYYDQDYNYLSAQLKKAKQHLDQIQVREEDKRR